MPIKLNVRGTVYNYPIAGEDPNWGNEATELIVALVDTVALLVGPNDILETSFIIENGQVTSELVRGLYFNPVEVRAANISYSVYRTTALTSVVEAGEMLISYDANAPVNQKWQVIQRVNGNAATLFTVDDTGQFFYTSSTIAGVNYTGLMKFTAKALST